MPISVEKATPVGEQTRPAPTSAPIKAWVVEIGKPKRVASKMVAAAPPPTASMNCGWPTSEASISPLPEKVLISAPASRIAVNDPASVVIVAQPSAIR